MGLFDKVRDLVTSLGAERSERPQRSEPPQRSERARDAEAATPTADVATAERDTEEASQEAGPAGHRTHTVRRGDTLVGIADRYGVDWREMAALNGLDNPDLIYAGQVFRVPDA